MTAIYLDFNASTPVDPRVLEAMIPHWEAPGNAGSRTHAYGQEAKQATDNARCQVAAVLGARSEEIVFTSGATESSNIALLGLARYGEETGRRHIVSSAIEHKAVLEPLEHLRTCGFEVDYVQPTSSGCVDPREVARLLRSDTLLVSIMHANNETGVLQPVADIADIVDSLDTFFHVDAAQTFGKQVDELRELQCDFLSISSHKVYGPQGIGALYERRRAGTRRVIRPLMFGGGQERGLRPGTLPVALVVGFGKAAALAAEEFQTRNEHAQQIKDSLLTDLSTVEHTVNGDLARSQPHVLNVSFPGVDSEALMMTLCDEMAISNGSACTSASYDPSHVLRAMKLSDRLIESAVRISWGPGVASVPTESLLRALKGLVVPT